MAESPTQAESAATARAADPVSDQRTPESRRPTFIAAGLIVASTAGIFFSPTMEGVGGAAAILMLVLMFMKAPVALALAIPGVLGLFSLNGVLALEHAISSIPYNATAQWSLSVLPMFILMGLLLASSGTTGKVYVAARMWLTWLPGGLAVGTNAAGAGLAAVSGSSIGTSYALGRIGIPEMLRAGYDRRVAVGSVIVAALPGQLIPPSTFLIIVAGITGVAVGPQLIAGVIPGVAMAAMFGVTLVAIALIRPAMVGRNRRSIRSENEPTVTWGERFRALVPVWPIAVLIIVLFGGMFSGVLTATEAGAFGAFGAVLFCWWFRRRERPMSYLKKGAAEAIASVGAIFLIVVGAHILSELLAVSRLGIAFTDWMIGMDLNRVQFLLLVMVAYLILGMVMDPLAILLLTIPLLQPTLETMGIDMLWFGVFAVFVAEMAIITPPVGILTYVVHKIAQEPDVNLGHRITLKDVFTSVGWFVPTAVLFAVTIILFPGLATWLPGLMSPG